MGVVHDIPLLWNLQGTNILMVGVGISPSQKKAMISSLNMTNPSGTTVLGLGAVETERVDTKSLRGPLLLWNFRGKLS